MADESPLAAEIRRRIAAAGPMPVHEFMQMSLFHPEYGYYVQRDPFGAGGDFITAPEISQMFGELIGLWAAEVWRMMGSVAAIALVELGPGRGTLMRDALRAARVVPQFRQAASVHLIEASRGLTERQKDTLREEAGIHWHGALAGVPEMPAIILANEFFDALPVHQAVKRADGWHARTVRLDADARLSFGLAAAPLPEFEQTLPAAVRDAPLDAVYEWRPDATAHEVARRCLLGGAALVIDYGYSESAAGETLQAVQDHRFADPLAAPGHADLTAHVDFAALAATAERIGVRTHGPTTQAAFLRRLGIEARAARLKSAAAAETAERIDAATRRLTDEGRTGMGATFKVMAFSHPSLDRLPGF